MHQCVKYETNFSAWCKKSAEERREEVRCSVCRILFCCSKDRKNHEDTEHGGEVARIAHQQRQIRKAKKPLVCLNCCQVFLSGLLITNDACTGRSDNEAGTTVHVFITIPDWAVAKYLVPNQRKRSWDKANEDVIVEIRVHLPKEKSVEDCVPYQESGSAQKSRIQSILTKQRKTDLSIKRSRRVTFSPVTAVAITTHRSIVKVESGKTGGVSSSDSAASSPSGQPTDATPPAPESKPLAPSGESTASAKPATDSASPRMPNTPTETRGFSAFVELEGDNCVFSPPLPDEGTNGSPMMAPQMSSTPVCDHLDRRSASTSTSDSSPQFQTTSEASGSNEGIFSSLANMICCAFQALPSVLTQFFLSVNSETDPNNLTKKEANVGRERRQRRRSATFTPYLPIPMKNRRLNRQRLHGPSRPSPITHCDLTGNKMN